MTNVSGTAVNNSLSSRCNSSSVLGGGTWVSASAPAGDRVSHEATRRWLRARATLARERIMSVSGSGICLVWLFIGVKIKDWVELSWVVYSMLDIYISTDGRI